MGLIRTCFTEVKQVKPVVSDFYDTMTVLTQAPHPWEFLGKEYWSGVPFSSRGSSLTRGLNLILLIVGRRFTFKEPGNPRFYFLGGQKPKTLR